MLTHSDIRKKFLIEYDKANITSSYPSLTDYEIATLLDKAYLALIALKVTGNNPRQAGFEADNKAIEDLRPLIVNKKFAKNNTAITTSTNEAVYDLPSDLLYYIKSVVDVRTSTPSSIDSNVHTHVQQPTRLITHELSDKFRCTSTNLPWIDIPVAFIDGNQLRVLYDSYAQTPGDLIGTYIKTPKKFTSDGNTTDEPGENGSGDGGTTGGQTEDNNLNVILDESKLDSYKLK